MPASHGFPEPRRDGCCDKHPRRTPRSRAYPVRPRPVPRGGRRAPHRCRAGAGDGVSAVSVVAVGVKQNRAGTSGDGAGAGELDAALDAARAGDERGFVELWSALNPLILRYLRVVVGQAAEDVASETWLQAARDVRGFRGDAAGFRVWLFRVARHRALDELRRCGRRLEDPVGLAGESANATLDHPAADDTAAEAVERLSTQEALQLIGRLPKDQAEAVLLRTVVGLDAKQCGHVLGKKPGAVRIAAMRGLRNLSGRLAERAAEPEQRTRLVQETQLVREAQPEPREQGAEVRRAVPRVRAAHEVAR